MDETANRLAKCFTLVFSKLSRDRIERASAANVSDWDSMAQLNLLSVIGEEFGIEIDFEEFEGATSFDELLAHLRQLNASA
jgi:acyl carrier protein